MGESSTIDTAKGFGALATRLTGSLAAARRALDAHRALLPAEMLAEMDALLSDFQRRRVRIAIYGEVKAGKSTLLNAIAGEILSPAAFEPLTSIPVRLTYGPRTVWRLGERELASVAELEETMRAGVGAEEVVVETDLDLLQLGGQVDIVDTPGVGSEERFDTVSAETLRALDAVVLVVRYPALFTRVTRQLVENLRADIGKLFVVWNLDRDCADLTAEQRTRHTETLRANAGGVQELHAVDARAGFEAKKNGDATGVAASGLTAFTEALSRFAGSGWREAAALREAAKRGQRWLDEARKRLAERRIRLEAELDAARARLREAGARSDSDAARVRAEHAGAEASIQRTVQQTQAALESLAQDLRRELRNARWRWVRRGDAETLSDAVARHTRAYAGAVDSALRKGLEEVGSIAVSVGAPFTLLPRPGADLAPPSFGPEDRIRAATAGPRQMIRRTIWQRWFLPGLADLEQSGISGELDSQRAWLAEMARVAVQRLSERLAERLGEIERQAAAAREAIMAETSFSANEAELARIARDAPLLDGEAQSVARAAADARQLM